jgi:cell wall-associated NlpC family hydrolase
MARPTVKGHPGSPEQVANMTVCCQIGKQMGASGEQLAGALATMIQESEAINMHGGDRDSAGLYQQRPSMGWGSYAQVTTPTYACRKFLTPYLGYCRKGMNVIDASNAVQRSAFPQAPAPWLAESRHNVQLILGSSDFTDATMPGVSEPATSTRTQPYEFSRGSANQLEDSWTAIGRLAQEVQWERFMRGGELWFVSDKWLARQTPRFLFAEGAQGVLAITHTADSRQPAAEATVTALANRWSVLPGDLVRVVGQGSGDGLWLVSQVRRTVTDATDEITLKRPTPPLPEPAATTSSTTVNVGGISSNRLGASAIGGGAAAGPAQAQALYNACKAISDRHYPYVWGGGHGRCGEPSGGGFDCSGSVCAALGAAHLGYRLGGNVDVSGTIASSWGMPGEGKSFTVWANAEHVWIQLKGLGPAWRFDTSPWGSGGDGPQLRTGPRSTSGFSARHWSGL